MVDIRQLSAIMSSIPVDIGGGSALDKIYVMAGLGAHLDLKTFVEIGLYRGRSFFPLARSFGQRGGHSYGVDPYNRTEARENDIPPHIHDVVTDFIDSADYEDLYRQILNRRESLNFSAVTQIIRDTSDHAIEFFKQRNISADMVHVDGNHDRQKMMSDVKKYIDIMADQSLMVIDDVNWPSVGEALAYAKTRLSLIFQTETYAILRKSTDRARNRDLSEFCRALERHALRFLDQGRKPKVSVSMITFNQERYIGQAIESALSQDTDFDIEIVIGEDGSTDRTRAICRSYRNRYPDKIHLIERPRNIGAVANYLETYKDCKGEYVAFLEGDDFWIDPLKLRKQVEFLDHNRDYAICFHNVLLSDSTGRLLEPLFKTLPDTSTAADLCMGEYISTPSCMIRNGQVGEVPDWLYSLPGCDWPFDILNAEHGKIKYLDETMAAYRRHDTGMWSGASSRDQYATAVYIGLELDKHFGFRYHPQFNYYIERNKFAWMTTSDTQVPTSKMQVTAPEAVPGAEGASEISHAPSMAWWGKRIERKIRSIRKAAMTRLEPFQEKCAAFFHPQPRKTNETERCRDSRKSPGTPAPALKLDRWQGENHVLAPERDGQQVSGPPLDLVIVDDAFPQPQSSFRLEEYQAYLTAFEHARVYTSGRAFSWFSDNRPLVEVIAEHDARNPTLSGRTLPYIDTRNGIQARLGYTIFAGNAWENIDFFEKNNIPFVFTLYPGGSFFINDETSDRRLRRIFDSPMFRRVIVTQNLTLDYILQHKLCHSDKIEFIYGVVTPSLNLSPLEYEHIHYGFGKNILNICFTAHKYTIDGHDKGYDIFLDVARAMASRFDDCHFHVVGGFEESDLPLDGLEGRITFYGGQDQQWLRTFYRDKDLILLCNVPFILMPGAFDGFPTGCGSDAMLNEVALFCTDPLNLNRAFVDGRDLVIVPHDVETIVDRLSWYRDHPEALRDLAHNGRQQAVHVYSFEAQIAPRLALLQREIAAAGG